MLALHQSRSFPPEETLDPRLHIKHLSRSSMGAHDNLLLDAGSNLKSLCPLQFNKFHPKHIIKQTVDTL